MRIVATHFGLTRRLALVLGAACCAPVQVHGQVVQLPVLDQFSIHTSVWVPDGGTAPLGGINRRGESMALFGPRLPGLPSSRGYGRDMSSLRAGVSATIIDLKEWDRAVLRMASDRVDRSEPPEATRVTRAVRDDSRDGVPLSPTQIEQAKNDRLARGRAEALEFVARARDFRRQGKLTTARYCYESAMRRADPELRAEITGELEATRAAIANGKATRR